MNNKDIIELVIAVISGVATILATYLSYRAIKQTERNSVITSNQFLFDRRLEILHYFQEIIFLSKNMGLHVTEMTETTRKYAEDPFRVDETMKQLTSILSMQFNLFTNNLLFYELGSMVVEVEEGSAKVYNKERQKCVVFVEEMHTKVKSIDYLFVDDCLKFKLKSVLEGYLDGLSKYNVLFWELHNVKGAYDFAVFFLTYDNMKSDVEKLKVILDNFDLEELNRQIQNELSVF